MLNSTQLAQQLIIPSQLRLSRPAIARRRLPAAATPGHASSRHSGSPETRAGQIPASRMMARATWPPATAPRHRVACTLPSRPSEPAATPRPATMNGPLLRLALDRAGTNTYSWHPSPGAGPVRDGQSPSP